MIHCKGWNGFETVVSKTNKIILQCDTTPNSIKKLVTNPESVEIFVDLLGQRINSKISDSHVIGFIHYYRDDSLMLSAKAFQEGISFVIDGRVYYSRMTYRAGMLFGNECSSSFGNK